MRSRDHINTLLDLHAYPVVRRSLKRPAALNPSPWRGEGQGRG